MRNKRAQAAMEFIMTYGWAILAVTVVIGALVYFGIFSPARFLPETCSFPSELTCVGKALTTAHATAGSIEFVVSNNVGNDIKIDPADISATGDCTSASATVDGGAVEVTVGNAKRATIKITCGAVTAGRMKSTVTVKYTNTLNSLKFPATGEVQSNAQ